MSNEDKKYEIIESNGERFILMSIGNYLAEGVLFEPYELQPREYIPSIRKVASQVLKWVGHLSTYDFVPLVGRNHSGHYESYRNTVMRIPKGLWRKKTRLVTIFRQRTTEEEMRCDNYRQVLSERNALYEWRMFLGENGMMYSVKSYWQNENPEGLLGVKIVTDVFLSGLTLGDMDTIYKGLLSILSRAQYRYSAPLDELRKDSAEISRIQRRLWPS